MIREQVSIKTVFDLTPRDWASMQDWNLEELLDWMTEIIPGSDYFFEVDYEKRNVLHAQSQAKERARQGDTLYMIYDDPDVVHWIAFNKKYMPIIMKMKPFLPMGFFIESFSPADLTWEGE